MLQAKRTSTHKQYNTYISAWLAYCESHDISPTSATVPQALSFLESIRRERQLGFNAINTARSALSSLLPHTDGVPFGQNWHVKLYMRGTFHVCPPCPRYATTWDPTVVLDYLKDWAPPNDITMQQLTLKVLMLALLVSGQRIHSFSVVEVEDLQLLDSQIIIHFGNKLKQSRPGYRTPDVALKAFPQDSSLCIYTYMLEYLRRTAPIRGDQKLLFITLKPPYKGASNSKDTLSRWVKKVMSSAGIDTNLFLPHSVRAASTSAAKRGGASVKEIMDSAGWSRTSTFTTFYDKQVADPHMFDVAVLSNKC